MPPTPDRGSRRWIAPLGVGVLGVVRVAGAGLVIGRADDPDTASRPPGDLPVLRLDSGTAGAEVGTPASPQGRDRFVLAGRLPTDRPGAAPIYRFGSGAGPAERVSKLAGALGLRGTPKRAEGQWYLADGRRVLTVDDGGDWQWQLTGPITPDTSVKCVRAPCPALPGPRGLPGPPIDVAKRIATDVLAALGLPADDLRATANGPVVEVRAPRRVGGRQVDAFSTELSVGSDRKIHRGQGWLGAPRQGPAYPLVSAAEAFRRLQAQPYAEIAICHQLPGGGCAPPPKVKVFGADLGLMRSHDQRGALLVPAWLFRVSGQEAPLAVVAVQSRYLGEPAAPVTSPSGSSGGGSGGGVPGSPASAPPPPPTAVPSGPPHEPTTPPR